MTGIPEVEDPDGGFIVEPTVLRLTWAEGDRFHGLVVRVLSLPLGRLLDLAPRIDAITEMQRTGSIPIDRIGQALEPFRLISEYLVGWNLKTRVEGVVRDVPATFDGLMSQDPAFIIGLLQAWTQASGGISDPLGQPLPAGGIDRDMESALAMIPRS